MTAPFDLIVIGAGPAGLTAALVYKRLLPVARVVVLDRMPEAGAKLAVTGGGRGNLSRDLPPDDMAAAFGKHSARFVASAIRDFPPAALREFFRGIGVPTVVEPGGGIYPASQSAAAVREALVSAVRRSGVELRLGVTVTRLVPPGFSESSGKKDANASPFWRAFSVSAPSPLCARRVLLAAGGRSAPALGSDGSGFALALSLGHTVDSPVPALAPLHTVDAWPSRLAGVSVHDVTLALPSASINLPASATGDLLFTHKGLSGPAALNLSAAVARRLATGMLTVNVRLALLPAPPDFRRLRQTHGSRAILTPLARLLPRALATELLALADVPVDTPCARLTAPQTRALADALTALLVPVSSTGTFAESMATAGGVVLPEVFPRTLASRYHPTLSFAGEILDIVGPTGGYNLHWAFASGHLAATALARS